MDMVLQDILWLINIVLKAFERFELIELRVILGINKQQKFNDTIWS